MKRYFPLILSLIVVGGALFANVSSAPDRYACRDYCKELKGNGGIQVIDSCQKCCRERVGTKECEEKCARSDFRPVDCSQYYLKRAFNQIVLNAMLGIDEEAVGLVTPPPLNCR
jgi:hypothetical protein